MPLCSRMSSLLQLPTRSVLVWTLWRVFKVRRTMQVPARMGGDGLLDTSYVFIDCVRVCADCLPECDSLADGEKRRQREEGHKCDCKDGWGGVNCNVCKTDAACLNFPIRGAPSESDDDTIGAANMTCYKGGETVFQNHQICNVTNRKILDMLPDRPPEVTFSCDNDDRTCQFQFWTAQVESFYCSLDACTSDVEIGHDTNTTKYSCDKMQCKCVPGRFICGENGSIGMHAIIYSYHTIPTFV